MRDRRTSFVVVNRAVSVEWYLVSGWEPKSRWAESPVKAMVAEFDHSPLTSRLFGILSFFLIFSLLFRSPSVTLKFRHYLG
jgi:hypothetical protein